MNYTEWDDFQTKYEIARGATNEAYSNSGYIALVNTETGEAAIQAFSHCSCNGTSDDIPSDGWAGKWTWKGTPDALVVMAHFRKDPYFPDRPSDTKDCSYPQLEEMYRGVLEWNKKRPAPAAEPYDGCAL